MIARGFRILVLLIVWLVLAGEVTWVTVALGLGVAGFALVVAIRTEKTDKWWQRRSQLRPLGVIDILQRVGLAILFIPVFLREVYSGALNVAGHSLEIRPTMHPGIVRVPTRLRNKTAIVILANLITLSPGTLTMDFDENTHCYFVHCIDAGDAVEDRAVIVTMEAWLRRIFE